MTSRARPVAVPSTEMALLAAARLARVLDKAAAELGLAHYRFLTLVAAGDERASRLAERLALGKPAVSAAVGALVSQGLLTRDDVAGDQRAIRLRLTDEGRAVLARTEAAMAARLSELADGTDDPAATMQALVSLGEAIDRDLAERRAAKGHP
ncbi:MAG: MarR family winged helix-turn-helix transcriptional regulator [Acidimicrobiales bacterium]